MANAFQNNAFQDNAFQSQAVAITGTGSVIFRVAALAASGTVAVATTGTGAVRFGVPRLDGLGGQPAVSGEFGHVVSDTGRRLRFPLQPEPLPVTGAGGLTIRHPRLKAIGETYWPAAFSVEELSALAGELSDEELVALLAA